MFMYPSKHDNTPAQEQLVTLILDTVLEVRRSTRTTVVDTRSESHDNAFSDNAFEKLGR